ncbi:response regulator [Oceanibacterium hippocampi]|uniref:Transcriptional regulatory protein DegU n=1 Tax=Oceanibacterium hippocampi TaxID=745714 RepID=A0A1Y5TJB2_9PROT|nr:response regulator transcription factor [Oceanibacterium hippocampi]SLN65326.1 Transcriptional regulatory protein DegU [Oceanibacterium hippocampi]
MRILFADDHDLVRDTVTSYLEGLDLNLSVISVRTFQEALASAEAAESLDLILLDIDMPGMNGLEGLDVMRQKVPDVPVAILSGLSTPDNIVKALKTGASGFIPKSMGARAMVGAIQLILAGDRYVPSKLVDQIEEQLAAAAEVAARKLEEPLNSDEATILGLLKKGNSNKEIARSLDTEEYTVKYHMRGLFRKLGAKNRTQAVMIASERGLP